MAVIGVSINEVIRHYIGQLIYTYDKYINEMTITPEDVTSLNLIDFFKFDDTAELNKFLYSEASLEIFGHADQMYDGLMSHFNNLLMDIEDEEEHEIIIVSKEINKTIPATYFFLSKLGCRIKKISFVDSDIKEWDGVDILITANPEAIKNKPSGKTCVKIKAPYNVNEKADFELDSILDFIKDDDLKNTILNTKITNYEEL